MPAPNRTTGLPYHLFYPLVSGILLAIAAFSSADSVWYVSANTLSETVGREVRSSALTNICKGEVCCSRLVRLPFPNTSMNDGRVSDALRSFFRVIAVGTRSPTLSSFPNWAASIEAINIRFQKMVISDSQSPMISRTTCRE